MIQFVRSPLYENWFKGQKPQNEIVICCPFVKKTALDRIVEHFGLDEKSCNIRIRVLIRGKLEDFVRGSSDLAAIESLKRLCRVTEVDVRRLTNLHMTAYEIDHRQLLIGSGNWTNRGLFALGLDGNVEAAVATDDECAIGDFERYYEEVIGSSQSLDQFYATLCDEYAKYAVQTKVQQVRLIDTFDTSSEKKAQYSVGKHKGLAASGSTITVEDIPQYSTFSKATEDLFELLSSVKEPVTFLTAGRHFLGGERSDVAYRKYGENHSKLAELLDLVAISYDRPRQIHLTALGSVFSTANEQDKKEILRTQILRMNIVQDILRKCSAGGFTLDGYLMPYLAPSTVERRKSNVRTLFTQLRALGVRGVDAVLAKLS